MKEVILGIALLTGISLDAQTPTPVSVYTCSAHLPPTQSAVLSYPNNTFSRFCVDLTDPGNYMFNDNTYNAASVANKTIKAGNYIHADETCHIGPFTGSKDMHWMIETPQVSPFDVAVMNYTNLDGIAKLKKFELGVQIPLDVLTKINNFLAKADVLPKDKLNPFVDWDVDMDATFTHTADGFTKTIDGFYYREYEQNSDATDWTPIATSYPFRVRFSPPQTGEWSCSIIIKVKGLVAYSSASFTFNVIDIGAHGYAKVHGNHRNIELDGRIIFPVGQNFPYPDMGLIDPAFNATNKAAPPSAWNLYHQDLHDYQEQGGKYIRISQGAPSSLIEFEEKGNYYNRLHYAWETDKYIQYCDDHDMLINFNMLFQEPLMQYGQYDNWKWDFSNYRWSWNEMDFYFDYPPNSDHFPTYCYNDSPGIENGELPHNMFLDEDDLKYHEQRTRYYIARYGYSTSVMQFELLSESWHLDEFYRPDNVNINGYSNSFEYMNTPEGDIVRQALLNYNTRISNYIKNVLGHGEHLIGLHAYDNSIFGYDPSYLQDQSCGLSTIDVIGLSTYHIEPNRLFLSGDGGLGSDEMDSGENSYYHKALFFHSSFNKPFMHFEQGSIGTIGYNECTNYDVHRMDTRTIGFTGCAGFFPWEGYYTHGISNGHYGELAWPYTIQGQNWMNNDEVINVLSEDQGSWYQGRQKGKIMSGDHKDVKEVEYYLDQSKNNGVGFILNRTRNYYTHNVNSCSVSSPGSDLDALSNFAWGDGPDPLFVKGLDYNSNYLVTYYDMNGYQVDQDCYGSGIDTKVKLKHPVLHGGDNTALLWFTIHRNNCQPNGIMQYPNDPELMSKEGYLNNPDEADALRSTNISPNPFIKNLEIDVEEDAQFEIYSSDYEKVYSGKVFKGKNQLNLESLSRGVYFLKLSTGDKMYKIVKI